MDRNNNTIRFVGFIIIIVVAIAGMTWINLRFSNWGYWGTDFYVNWSGARALIIDGKSPYDSVATSETKDVITDRYSLLNAEGNVISSPVFSFLLVLPFAVIEDFELAWALWSTSQQIALSILILLLIKITRWRPKYWEFGLLFIGIYLSYLTILTFISGNMIILTALMLVIALYAINIRRDEIAGGVLALTTVQPQVFIISILFILYWALINKRRLIIIWFFGFLFILTGIGVIFIQDWPIQYLRMLSHFMENFPYLSLHEQLAHRWSGIGAQLSWTITIVSGVVLIIEAWLIRNKEFRWFLWTTNLTLVLSRILGLPVHPTHNFILIIPLVLVFSVLEERWPKASGWMMVSLFLMLTGGWVQLINKDFSLATPNQLSLLYSLPIFLIITLYWVRWWAIRPRRLYTQELYYRG